MRRFFLIVMTLVLLAAKTTHAEQANPFKPALSRLLVHSATSISESIELRAHFIPAGNLSNGIAPLAYAGIGFKPLNWLDVETVAGFAFGAAGDEPIASVRIAPTFGQFYGWSEFDIQPSKKGYWFVQAEYKFYQWLHAGIEGEGFGTYQDSASWSHGGGPNVLLRFGKTGMDLALQARDCAGGAFNPQFVTRFHLFL